MSQIWKSGAGNAMIWMAPFLGLWNSCSSYWLVMAHLVDVEELLPDVQIVFFNIGWQSTLSRVFTFAIADLPIGIVIMLLDQNYCPDISYLQLYNRRLGWMFKHLIANEYWLSSAMHVQVLSQGVLLGCSVNSDSSPGWR
jgi:hypothetical protein